MDWINVNGKYLDYLRGVEGRIPYTDYGNDKYKPSVGFNLIVELCKKLPGALKMPGSLILI